MSGTNVVTGEARFSYVHLATPQMPSETDVTTKPKYSLTILVPKNDEKTVRLLREAEEAAKVTGKEKKWGGSIPRKVHSVIKDGDNDDEFEGAKGPGDEVRGHYVFTARTTDKPPVVDARVRQMDAADVYSGCYGRVSVQAFPYLFNGKAGVSFALKSVQFIRNGEPLGGSAPENPENVFDVVEVDDNEAYGDLI